MSGPSTTGTSGPGIQRAPGAFAFLARHLNPGDIVWVDMPPTVPTGSPGGLVGSEQRKTRPWVVISDRKRFQERGLGLFVGVPLTTKLHRQGPKFRILVPQANVTYQDTQLPPKDKLLRGDTLALTEHVRSLSERRILSKPGMVSASVVDDLRVAVAYILNLP